MKTFLGWILKITGIVAIGATIAFAVKMNTDTNFNSHIQSAFGIEQTVEDETLDDSDQLDGPGGTQDVEPVDPELPEDTTGTNTETTEE